MSSNYIDNSKILYCEAKGESTKYVMQNKKIKVKKRRLGTIEKSLDPDKFFRCHRKFLVNIENIKDVKLKNNQLNLIMSNKHKIEVSFRKKAVFYDFINNKYSIL